MNSVLSHAMELSREVESTKARLKQIFQCTSLALDERWEHFLAFYILGGSSSDSSYTGWDDIPCFPQEDWRGEVTNSICWYDDFGIERYQTVDLLDKLDIFIDRAVEDSPEFKNNYDALNAKWELEPEYWSNKQFQQEQAELFNSLPTYKEAKEALMRDAVTGFTYDW